jgi:membrane protein YdbS with pleckstrin-like domain
MKDILKFVVSLFIGVLIGVFVLFIIHSLWQLERKWNYGFSYKSMVQQTVREMVKEEALR